MRSGSSSTTPRYRRCLERYLPPKIRIHQISHPTTSHNEHKPQEYLPACISRPIHAARISLSDSPSHPLLSCLYVPAPAPPQQREHHRHHLHALTQPTPLSLPCKRPRNLMNRAPPSRPSVQQHALPSIPSGSHAPTCLPTLASRLHHVRQGYVCSDRSRSSDSHVMSCRVVGGRERQREGEGCQ